MQQYEPLFLKYRPQALADLVGQEYVGRTLSNAIEHNRISHAYLFTGPRGTGKTSSARILAKCLNCEQGPTVSPCQICTSCIEIKQGNSPAVLEIDAASNNSVDDARVLIERAPLVAPGGRYKLYIIDECHMLTKEAFNALLKTIEEPPANVIFVLATTEEHKVPQTIVSRCQKLIFRLVNPSALVAHLTKIAKQENINIEPTALELIARRSSGGMRDALGLLDQASLLRPSSESITIQDLILLSGALEEDVLMAIGKSVIDQDSRTTIELAHQLINEGKEPYIIASELAKHMLNLVKAAYLNPSESLDGQLTTDGGRSIDSFRAFLSGSPQYIENLIAAASGLDRFELAQIVEQLDRLEQGCKRSTRPIVSLEIGLLVLCHRLESKALINIEDRLAALEAALDGYAKTPLSILSPVQEKTKANVSEHQASEHEMRKPGHVENRQENLPEREEITELACEEPVSEARAPVVPEKIDRSAEEPSTCSQENLTDENLDAVWIELLEELQNRHLPTFSLVSTHAFPVSLSKDEFILGVHFENFQKMIDSKLVYINQASQLVLKRTLQVKIRVVSKPRAALGLASGRAKPAHRESSDNVSEPLDEPQAANRLMTSKATNGSLAAKPTNERPADQKGLSQSPDAVSHQEAAIKTENRDGINITQEAYGLFEGPGSRLITASAIEAKD